MNRNAAREILERFRPGTPVADEDEDLRLALELARSDVELGRWFRQHCEFQDAAKRKLRSIPVPTGLKARIRARHEAQKVVAFPKPIWRQPQWLAAAAGIALCCALAGLGRTRERVPDSFADYRARMVRSVLREYRMDVRATEMAAVREFMKAKGAPDDFEIPHGLARLELAGGGFLIWRSQPVSMICFRHSQAGMSYLFVLDRANSKEAPPAVPEIVTINGRSSAAWTAGNRIYFLTCAEGVDARALL